MSTSKGTDDKGKNSKDETIAKAAGAVIASGIAWSLFKSFQPKKAPEWSEIAMPEGEFQAQVEKEELELNVKVNPTTSSLRKKSFQKFKSKQSHNINKGDTLFGISRRYGVSIQDLKEANGLIGDTIRAGDTLVIPKN